MKAYQHLLTVGCWLLTVGMSTGAGNLRVSKHNLSAAGNGEATATTATEMCVFCHTPHTSKRDLGLWNREASSATYIPYKSTTTKARVGQPTGASKLCLSCHDGTVALGKVRNRSQEIPMKGGPLARVSGKSNLGTDLSDDHPISFKYDAALVSADGQLNKAPLSGRVHLDGNNEMQCTSCHDPHDDRNGKFLVMNNTASALCVTCHNLRSWRESSHSLSTKAWNGSAPNPWPHTNEKSVSANGCENCHDLHGAGGKQRLLNYATEEQNCYACHNANVAAKNIEAEFSKPSVHPVMGTTGVHDPMESSLVPRSSRHVECQDCHNPHTANSAPKGSAGTVGGALAGVRGVSISGADLPQVTYEYELCFRCHAENAKGPARIERQYPQLNTRVEFQITGINSYHPVAGPGRNPNVPSLKAPWTTASRISCGDCHNSDSAVLGGAKGPHGSSYPPLLERMLNLSDTGSNQGNSALCFKCHDFSNTAWSRHTEHMGMTSCMSCHDPHGSPNAHLINFNPSIVGGPRQFQDKGMSHGSCALTCHGTSHDGGPAYTY